VKTRIAVVAFALTAGGTLCASPIPNIPYADLYARSDLVVIGRPVESRDTREHATIRGLSVVGVTTDVRALFVFKGLRRQLFKLHHYRQWPKKTVYVGNPVGIRFEPPKNKRYLMFLVREPNGRFVPTLGHEDVQAVLVQEVMGSSADW
jgi:hypothetical protein